MWTSVSGSLASIAQSDMGSRVRTFSSWRTLGNENFRNGEYKTRLTDPVQQDTPGVSLLDTLEIENAPVTRWSPILTTVEQ